MQGIIDLMCQYTCQASSDSQLEARIIKSVAGYGKQLGRIGEVVEVVLQVLKLDDAGSQQGLNADQRKAIGDLRALRGKLKPVGMKMKNLINEGRKH